MAQKRMFDRAIIDTDRFMDLPMSAKALYFLLGMEADDEGFVSPKKVLRIHGGNDDDVKVLIGKNFVIPFQSGVVVITDWQKNNWLDSRRIRPTEYKLEKQLLALTEDKTYMLSTRLASAKTVESSREQNTCETEVSRVEDSYSIVVEEDTPTKKPPAFDPKPVYAVFHAILGVETFPWTANRTERLAAQNLLKRGSLAKIRSAVEFAKENEDHEHCPLILKPSDLDRKWDNLKVFKQKHG